MIIPQLLTRAVITIKQITANIQLSPADLDNILAYIERDLAKQAFLSLEDCYVTSVLVPCQFEQYGLDIQLTDDMKYGSGELPHRYVIECSTYDTDTCKPNRDDVVLVFEVSKDVIQSIAGSCLLKDTPKPQPLIDIVTTINGQRSDVLPMYLADLFSDDTDVYHRTISNDEMDKAVKNTRTDIEKDYHWACGDQELQASDTVTFKVSDCDITHTQTFKAVDFGFQQGCNPSSGTTKDFYSRFKSAFHAWCDEYCQINWRYRPIV